MRRAVISWSIAFALLLAAFLGTIAILNNTLYSASGFVASYLNALARHDTFGARQLPGVTVPSGATTTLLRRGALGSLSDIHLVSDTAGEHGLHTVTYSYLVGGKPGRSTFDVQQQGAFLGMFPQWTFARSPLSTVTVTVLHDSRFRANGWDASVGSIRGAPARFAVFAPGLYDFDHRSTYLTATPVPLAVTDIGGNSRVQVNVQANEAFRTQVSSELRGFLDDCAKQKVLLPTSCPFGKTFENRVDSPPAWSISKYPAVVIRPEATNGTWLVPYTKGAAHLKVNVLSLFDGSVSTFNSDVPFEVSYVITVHPDDQLTIKSLY